MHGEYKLVESQKVHITGGFVIGASLSEPHTGSKQWTIVRHIPERLYNERGKSHIVCS